MPVPYDSLLLGILVVLVLKEALLTNFMNTGEGVMCFQKPMWWWYLFLGYEAQLMNLPLIEGRSVVDVFTLYAYIHVSLQITLLHIFPSKYNGKEFFCEEPRVWVVDKRVFKLLFISSLNKWISKGWSWCILFVFNLLNKFCSITNKLYCGGTLLLNSWTGPRKLFFLKCLPIFRAIFINHFPSCSSIRDSIFDRYIDR